MGRVAVQILNGAAAERRAHFIIGDALEAAVSQATEEGREADKSFAELHGTNHIGLEAFVVASSGW